MDTELNNPDVVAEVRALFETYEAALVTRDMAVLDATFWNSPHTIRYSVTQCGYGFDAIHADRLAIMPPPGGSKEKRIRLEILTIGQDLATVNIEYKQRGLDQVGRQSQTWFRFPDLGWKVISAHVSLMPPGTGGPIPA